MKLQEIKRKKPNELLAMTEAAGIENPGQMLKQEMVFALLKRAAEEGTEITGEGVIEVLQDGFGYLRYPEANYRAFSSSGSRPVSSACSPTSRPSSSCSASPMASPAILIAVNVLLRERLRKAILQ